MAVCSAGARRDGVPVEGLCRHRCGPGRGPHLSSSAEGPLQQHRVWGLRVQEVRDGRGDNRTRKARFGSAPLRPLWCGLSCSPVHPLPHTCPWERCGVASFWRTRRRTGRILTPAGKVDTTTRRRVARLNLLYSDFFSDFSPITIVMHASFRKCGKKKRMKIVHNSTTVLACFLLEEQCSEQLFTR